MTMKTVKLLSVFGTRPEAVKMAPLVSELLRRPETECIVCVTAQHRQMLDGVLSHFGVSADYDLDIMEPGQTLCGITTKVLEGLGPVLRETRPDLVLVHGDTTTAFSAALAAFYERIPIAHVEAGLRTGNRYSPYPEEMNRSLLGRLSDYHFAPTARNAANLRREDVENGIFVTGNTVIDAIKYTTGKNSSGFAADELKSIDFKSRRVITLTCHRRENYGKPMENIFGAVRDLVRKFEDIEIVYPVHMNPQVRDPASAMLGGIPRIHITKPLDVSDMHLLMSESYMVMTDSGGLQEEAPALGKPVIVLRTETERPEAVEAGTAVVAGVEREAILEIAGALLSDAGKYERMAKAVNPYGDGRACERIADCILYGFGLRQERPEEFGI